MNRDVPAQFECFHAPVPAHTTAKTSTPTFSHASPTGRRPLGIPWASENQLPTPGEKFALETTASSQRVLQPMSRSIFAAESGLLPSPKYGRAPRWANFHEVCAAKGELHGWPTELGQVMREQERRNWWWLPIRSPDHGSSRMRGCGWTRPDAVTSGSVPCGLEPGAAGGSFRCKAAAHCPVHPMAVKNPRAPSCKSNMGNVPLEGRPPTGDSDTLCPGLIRVPMDINCSCWHRLR